MYLFVDELTNVDFSYLCPDRGLVGETWLANFGLEGELDEQGMVLDFGLVKKQFKQWLDSHLDHCLAVPMASPNLQLREQEDHVALTWESAIGEISMTCPRQAVALIPTVTIEPKTAAQWVTSQTTPLMPSNLKSLHLNFTTETIEGPYYHYSHGLKKHNGNCQRIAHGHRSRIAIWLDDARQPVLEQQWAKLWRDAYIGSREGVVAHTEHRTDFAYFAQQGRFTLSLPSSRVYLIDEETTVECIAQHICRQIKLQFPRCSVRVKAYEGIGKGAIATLNGSSQ